jgi:hypothetical protein
VTGAIKVGSESYDIDAMGIRDKSMGPRKPRDLQRHHWIQGLFDNGIGFMLFDAEEGNKGFKLGVVTHDARIFPANIEIPFRIERLDQQRDPVRLILEYEDGRLDIAHLLDRHIHRSLSGSGRGAARAAGTIGSMAAQRQDCGNRSH